MNGHFPVVRRSFLSLRCRQWQKQ